MKKILITLFVFLMSIGSILADEGAVADAPQKDAKVVISDSLVTKTLATIGPVSGTGESSGFNYEWTVKDPTVVFEEGQAKFKAKAKIKVKGIKYESDVNGSCQVSYDVDKNKVKLKVETAKFNIEFNLFGKKLKLGSVDVASFYSPEFEFDGPEPIEQTMTISLPDGQKTLHLQSTQPQLYIVPGAIEVASTVIVTEINPEEEEDLEE